VEPAYTTAAPLGVLSPYIIHCTSAHNSAQIIVSIFYTLTLILNFYPKLDILYLQTVSAFSVIFLQRTPS
jgi:hypothetical protein